jgi:hypothetical protein
MLCLAQYAKIVQKLGFPATFKEFKIQNIVGSCDVKFPIRLEGLAYAHSLFASVRSRNRARWGPSTLNCGWRCRASLEGVDVTGFPQPNAPYQTKRTSLRVWVGCVIPLRKSSGYQAHGWQTSERHQSSVTAMTSHQ